MKQSSFLPQRKILGSYFFLFLLSSVGAQEVPNDSNEEIDVPISTLNITNSDQVGQNATLNPLNTTETRPKCKQILKNFFDESVNEVSYPTYFHSYTLFEIFIFCPKIQLWFPEKMVDFFCEKLVKML